MGDHCKSTHVHSKMIDLLIYILSAGSNGYNCMWDEKLDLFYRHLQCAKCGVTVGASIHGCGEKDRGGLKTLIGKVDYCAYM